MRREALRELDRSELEPAVRDVLYRRREGLTAAALRRELNRHPAFDFDIPMKYLHSWLGELLEDDVVVLERPGRRYRLKEYAD